MTDDQRLRLAAARQRREAVIASTARAIHESRITYVESPPGDSEKPQIVSE